MFSIWFTTVSSDAPDNNNIPKIQPFNFPPNLSVGQKTKFLCTLIEGADPVNFRWFKDRQEITSNKNIEITYHKDMSILVINSINFNDAGNYTCTANNNFGSANHTSLLAVEAPPRWLFEPQDIDVKVGVAVQIECSAAGFPTPKITWKKISETGKSLGLHYGNSTFTISNVESEDNGNYVCKAENDIGHIQKVIRVTVLVPAKFEEKFAVVSSRRGDSTSLKCEATGDQPLSIVWKKDMVELGKSGGNRYEIFETLTPKGLKSELIIRETERTDSSMYSCEAENPYGKDDRNMKLLVLEVPARPLNVKVHDVWSRSVSVSWSPPYTGNSPITQYVVQYWRDQGAPHRLQEKDVTSSQTSTLIKELNPGTTYTLSVVAENAVGRGESSQTVTFTTGEEEPSGAPVDVSVEAKGSSSLFVSWKDPPRSDWNGQLKGYYVGYKVLDSAQPYSFKTLEYSQSTIHEHMITNLRKDTEYKIVVKAFNAAGSGPASQDVLVRTLGGDLPLPPIVFIASTTDSAIKVQWRPQDTRTPLTGHVIHYRKKSERWQQIPVLTPSENVFSINGLESGAMYQLYVTSANEFGEGDPSEVLNIKTSGHSNDNLILLAGGQDAPYYLDLSLLVPVAASVAAIIVVTIVVCIWVQKARGRRNLERALREEKHYNYGPASQRYVDIEKSRQYPYPDSDLSSNYPTPYATVPMRDDVSESGNDPHQEMKSFLPQSMKDRPLPVPKTSSLKKKEESHIYDSPQ